MRYFALCLLFCVFACKDTTRVTTLEEEKKGEKIEDKDDWRNFYKPLINNAGDTLLSPIPQDSVIAFFTRYGKKNKENRVRITTKYGDIDLQLWDKTPLERASFIYLVKNNYFNGTVFHRVVDDFVIQGGNSDESLPSMMRNSAGNYQLPPHFLPGERFGYGSVGLAKKWEDNPEDWHNPFDFFISLRNADHLNGKHTIFGEVIKGMTVVEKIAQLPTDSRDWPVNDIYMDIAVLP